LKGHSNSVTTIAFGYSDNILVSGSKDNSVKIWEFTKKSGPGTLTKNLVHTFKGHTASISSVCFSRDGLFLASAGKDNTINVYDMNSLRLLFTLTGHSSAITSIVFSQDSKSIFSGSNDGTIKEWNLARKCLSHTMVAINKEGVFEYISYSPDNRYNCSSGGKEYLFFEIFKKK
jgi:WD40 repeat protein